MGAEKPTRHEHQIRELLGRLEVASARAHLANQRGRTSEAQAAAREAIEALDRLRTTAAGAYPPSTASTELRIPLKNVSGHALGSRPIPAAKTDRPALRTPGSTPNTGTDAQIDDTANVERGLIEKEAQLRVPQTSLAAEQKDYKTLAATTTAVGPLTKAEVPIADSIRQIESGGYGANRLVEPLRDGTARTEKLTPNASGWPDQFGESPALVDNVWTSCLRSLTAAIGLPKRDTLGP